MLHVMEWPFLWLMIWVIGASMFASPVLTFQIPKRNSHAKSCPPNFKESPVILISTDGFRADFLERGLTPTIAQLYAQGASAPFIKPSYPSITIPNHYTIATGLLPAYHGIIGNKFYDPDFKAMFRPGNTQYYQQRFWGGEPIWKTVEKQGKIAATYFWPGSETVGQRPTYWHLYNESHPFQIRVQQVLSWLDLPSDKRPSFITLYMHEPDNKGHDFGPDSVQLNDALKLVDATVLQLIDGLKARNLFSCVNLIILADHGMAEAGPTRVIKAQQFSPNIGNRNTTRFWNGAAPRVEPIDGSQATVRRIINDLACKREEMRVYHKHQLPIRFHFGAQRRVEDVVLDLDPGFQVDFDGTYKPDLGDHGYDNFFQTMNALFLAHGPAFKEFTEVESFQNIEIYNLLCALLDIRPAPNNGTWGALHHILNDPPRIEDNLDFRVPPAATVPSSPQELKTRRRTSKCSSEKEYSKIWESVTAATIKFSRDLLDVHLPWGIPNVQDKALSVKLLYHFDHITAYSEKLKLPLWTAFHYERSEGSLAVKWLDDLRISSNSLNKPCYDQSLPAKYGWEPLFHPFFSIENQFAELPFLTSNAVPVSSFLSKKWSQLRSFIEDYREGYEGINVILGTAFDFNNDTLVDNAASIRVHDSSSPIVPSHMFAVITRCLGGGGLACHPDLLDAFAFVFPQSLESSNCMEFEAFAREFSAKVNDVELLTGLQFFPLLKLQNRVALRTRIHSNLWGEETWRNRLKSDRFGLRR